MRFTSHKDEAGGACVNEERDRSEIIERASSDAYSFPSFAIVRPMVASAMDGAAPKIPAKLLGAKDLARDRKGAHHESANEESDEELTHLIDQQAFAFMPLSEPS